MFTSSQSWTVPAGVSSAFVTMAGGGGSGTGWRIINATYTGNSGGYVFSQPVNLVAGETLSVMVGIGGIGYPPVYNGSYYVPPDGDNGLGGYPGGSSMLVSPSAGTLLECAGGSNLHPGSVSNFDGATVPGPLSGGNTPGNSLGPYPTPNRPATGNYATSRGPGACGPSGYGIGNQGTELFNPSPGFRVGGTTPFGYGSGGGIGFSGCYVSPTTIGTCISPASGRSGVVFIDVLY